MNFYLKKITSYKYDLKGHLKLITSPIEEIRNFTEKKEKNINQFLLEDLKKEIVIYFVKNLIYKENLSLFDLADILQKQFLKKYNQIFVSSSKNKNSLKNEFVELTHYLFDRLIIKKDKELPEFKEGEIFFWVPKDDFLRDIEEEFFKIIRSCVILWKNSAKLFTRLKDLIIKTQKILGGIGKNIKINQLAKKLTDYEKLKIKCESDKSKIRDKIYKNYNSLNANNKKIKITKIPAYIPKKSKKVKLSSKLKKKGIFSFFDKKLKNEVDFSKIKTYSRWKSYGNYKFQIPFKEKKRRNIIKFINKEEEILEVPSILNIKNYYKRKDKQKQKKVIKYRLIRFEDFLSNFKEYKGLFDFSIFEENRNNLNSVKQIERFDNIFNYEIHTEDEELCIEADSIKGSEKSDDEEIHEEFNDFLVPDYYYSDDENNEEKIEDLKKEYEIIKKKRKGISSDNKSNKIVFCDFSKGNLEKKNLQLKNTFSIINLTKKEFPLKWADIDTSTEKDKITQTVLSKIILEIIGLPNKKEIYKVLEKQNLQIPKKEIYKKIKQFSYLVHYVNPNSFQAAIENYDYFEILSQNMIQKEPLIRNSTNFRQKLFLLVQGISNDKEDRIRMVYSPIKKEFYSVKKNFIDKNIKSQTRVGFIFSLKFLRSIKISKELVLEKLKSRFEN